MRLITLTVALLGGAAVLASIVGVRLTRRSFELGMLVTACALAIVVAGNSAWSTSSQFLSQRKQNKALSGPAAVTAGGRHVGVNADFVEWARSKLRDGETYYVMPSGPEAAGGAPYQWVTFRLLPHVSVNTKDEADVLIFFGVAPRSTSYDRTRFNSVERFGPDFAIAR